MKTAFDMFMEEEDDCGGKHESPALVFGSGRH
jgi:hypothetical protein